MAQNDFLKRYLDAGLEFTALTQARAEALVKDLVRAGEVQADQAREAAAELLDRSRQSSERLLDTVHQEVRSQITSLGLATQADLDKLEARIARLFGAVEEAGEAVEQTLADQAPAKKSAAKKAPAKKSAAKKSAAKKSAAKKSTAKKAPAKRSAAKKAAPKKQG